MSHPRAMGCSVGVWVLSCAGHHTCVVMPPQAAPVGWHAPDAAGTALALPAQQRADAAGRGLEKELGEWDGCESWVRDDAQRARKGKRRPPLIRRAAQGAVPDIYAGIMRALAAARACCGASGTRFLVWAEGDWVGGKAAPKTSSSNAQPGAWCRLVRAGEARRQERIDEMQLSTGKAPWAHLSLAALRHLCPSEWRPLR